MMLGRDESMPHVREPDLTSEEREAVRGFAESLLSMRQDVSAQNLVIGAFLKGRVDARLLARAILRYVPEGVPESSPHVVSSAEDQTRRAMPAAGVICEPMTPESSDGICEVSDDGSTSQNRLNFTAAYDPTVHGDHDLTRK